MVKLRHLIFGGMTIALTIVFAPINLAAKEVHPGQKIFKKCVACHEIGPKAKHKIGPALNDIINRAAGAASGFDRYSKAMKKAAASGLVWDKAELDLFLKAPRNYLPGTKMSFVGLKKARDREILIEYLDQFAHAELDANAALLGEEILNLEGDWAYGEYLSGECVSCHRSGSQIPQLDGIKRSVFVDAMVRYQQGKRKNSTMQDIARQLGDEELAALAAFYEQGAE